MAFGCPFEDVVEPVVVNTVVHALVEAGAHVIVLADTLGVGKPAQVSELVKGAVDSGVPTDILGLHCHDTFGRAAINCARGLELGLRHLDSSVGGLGGCPFAPGARGMSLLMNFCEGFKQKMSSICIAWDKHIYCSKTCWGEHSIRRSCKYSRRSNLAEDSA